MISAAAIVDIAVLDHAVGAISGNDDVIENQDANPIQQMLKL